MNVTMDGVGRVVLPKPLREALGLGPGTQFDAVVDGSGIRLEPRAAAGRRMVVVDGWPALEAVSGQVLADDDVRRIRDDQR